jgi:hypothetical protein
MCLNQAGGKYGNHYRFTAVCREPAVRWALAQQRKSQVRDGGSPGCGACALNRPPVRGAVGSEDRQAEARPAPHGVRPRLLGGGTRHRDVAGQDDGIGVADRQLQADARSVVAERLLVRPKSESTSITVRCGYPER